MTASAALRLPARKAAFQLRQVCQELTVRPITVWDSEYGNASFVKQTADIPADKIMRLRPNRCLWREPPPYSGRGCPRKHGAKFKLNDSSTWGTPQQTLIVDHPTWGRVEIQHWEKIHFRQSPSVAMELLRINRTGEKLTHKEHKPMWLVWVGGTLPALESVWRDYLRRFAVDHWNRLAKQRLHWRATPRRRQTQAVGPRARSTRKGTPTKRGNARAGLYPS